MKLTLMNYNRPSSIGRVQALRLALSSRLFAVVATTSALAYLAFFEYLDFLTNAPIMAGTSYFLLFYPLVGISAILMGLTAYSFRRGLVGRMIDNDAASGSSSVGSSVVGGLISCSCHSSLLLPLLTLGGLGASSGLGVISGLVEYQNWILGVFIAIDLFLIHRTLGRIRSTVK